MLKLRPVEKNETKQQLLICNTFFSLRLLKCLIYLTISHIKGRCLFSTVTLAYLNLDLMLRPLLAKFLPSFRKFPWFV